MLASGQTQAHMVMSISGKLPASSAASSEFSTSSRTVVYRHFPGCAQAEHAWVLPLENRPTLTDEQSAHVVKASDVAIVCKELGRALLLKSICLLPHAALTFKASDSPVT